MRGLTQSWPLTVERILDHAAVWRPETEVVGRSAEGRVVRTGYAALHGRARKLASSLSKLGVERGRPVAVAGANTVRQFEALYAVMGMGAVAMPVSPRLSNEALVSALNSSDASAVFIDADLLSGLEGALANLGGKPVVIMADAAHLIPDSLANAHLHDLLIEQSSESGPWGGIDENDAALALQTLGATGEPRVAVWSHRAAVLSGLIGKGREALDLAASDTVMLAMPFSRAAGWGGLFAGPAAGAKLVLPGPRMDAQSLQSLAEAERANVALASPADVKALLEHLQATGGRLGSLKRIIAAGGQLPPNLAQEFKSNFGVQVRSAYGLTETGALGVVGDPLVPGDLRPPFGLELAVTDGAGNPLPRDNAAIGRLKAKGATVASGYLGAEGAGLDPHGFLDTGDLGAADAAGSLRLTDRASEVISSGGQWISARALESAALEHPATAEVAAIAFPSDDGADRPLLVVRRRPGANAGKQEYLAFLQRRLPRGQSPADVLFVEGLPLDAAGRIDKRVLRDRLDRHRARAEGRAVEAPVAAVASVAAAAPMLYSPASPPPVHDESVRASAAPEPVIAGVETLAADDTVKAASAEHLAEVTARPEAEPPIADEPISLVASETAATESVEASHAAAEDAPAEPEPAEPMVETVTPEPGSPPGPALDGPTDAVMADARPAPPPSVVIVDPAVDEAEAPLLIAPAKPKKRKSVNGPVGLYLNLAVALALLPLALMAIGYGLVRFGLIDAQQGVSSLILDWPFKLATVGVVTGLIGLFAALFAGFGKVWRRALIALGLPVLVIAGFIAFRTTAEAQPPIHEVATDWADPIAFSPRLLALRGRGANPVMDEAYVPSTARTYAGRRIAEVNAETCQAAKPAILATDPAQAYARAKAALQEQGWTLVSDLAAEGRLEATRENILLGEKDDMAVRVQAYGAGARVDARASARSGESDLGRNCANVGDLIAAVRG